MVMMENFVSYTNISYILEATYLSKGLGYIFLFFLRHLLEIGIDECTLPQLIKTKAYSFVHNVDMKGPTPSFHTSAGI